MKKTFLLIFLFLFILFPKDIHAESCINLKQASGSEPTITIMILAFGYTDVPALQTVLSQSIANIFTTLEPMKSNEHLFSFWFASSPILPDRSAYNELKSALEQTCNPKNTLSNTYTVIYSNRMPAPGGPSAIASVGEGANVALFQSKRGFSDSVVEGQTYLIAHELFGHGIAGLVDEYTSVSTMEEQQAKNISTGINCFVGTYDACLTSSPWSDLIGQGCGNPNTIDCLDTTDSYKEVGCYEGCRVLQTGAYRPHLESIMNEKRKDFFGLVHQRELCTHIQEQTGHATGYCYTQFHLGIDSTISPTTIRENSTKTLTKSSPFFSPVRLALGGILVIMLLIIAFFVSKGE